MTESAAKEQITYTIIDVLLRLKPQDKARQQIFQILSVEKSANTATARCMIKDALRQNGHAVEHERIQCCIDTFHDLTNGFARWFHGLREDYWEQYPAKELIEVASMEETVSWLERWQSCGGRIYSSDRMVATIDDPIWLKISDFGLPFPPFALNSGMGWSAVSREDFIALGGTVDDLAPGGTDFGSGQVKLNKERFDPDILDSLISKIDSGDLKFRVHVEVVK